MKQTLQEYLLNTGVVGVYIDELPVVVPASDLARDAEWNLVMDAEIDITSAVFVIDDKTIAIYTEDYGYGGLQKVKGVPHTLKPCKWY